MYVNIPENSVCFGSIPDEKNVWCLKIGALKNVWLTLYRPDSSTGSRSRISQLLEAKGEDVRGGGKME